MRAIPHAPSDVMQALACARFGAGKRPSSVLQPCQGNIQNLCSVGMIAQSVTLNPEFLNAVDTLMVYMGASNWNNFYEYLATSFIQCECAVIRLRSCDSGRRFGGHSPARGRLKCSRRAPMRRYTHWRLRHNIPSRSMQHTARTRSPQSRWEGSHPQSTRRPLPDLLPCRVATSHGEMYIHMWLAAPACLFACCNASCPYAS